MANAFAQINSTWNGSGWSGTNPWATTAAGGTPMIPATGDVLIANGRTLTIEGNLVAGGLRNDVISGSSSGGGFTTTGTYAVTTGSIVSATTSVLTNTGTGTLTLVCTTINCSGGSEYAVRHSGSGTTNITATIVTGTPSGNGATSVANSGSGTLNLTATALSSSSSNGIYGAFLHSGLGTSTITGATISGGTASNTACVYNTSPGGTLVLDGCTVNGSPGSSSTVSSSGSAAVTKILENCTLNASATAAAFVCLTTNAVNYISGIENDHLNGKCAVLVVNRISGQPAGFGQPTSQVIRRSLDGTSTYVRYYLPGNPDSQSGQPAESDVRFETVYGANNEFIGTCHVPIPDAVSIGAPVDHTVGTGVIRPADLTGIPSVADITEGIASVFATELIRLSNCATVDSTGAQLAAING